jgi:hypothetical protein
MPELDQSNHSVSRNLRKNRGDDRGDDLIRGLWESGTDCIIDIRVTDFIRLEQYLARPRQGLGKSRKGEKEEILRGLPQATSSFHSFRGLH